MRGDRQRRGLEPVARVAAPQPRQRRAERDGDRALHRVGERNAAAPHARPGEHALDLVPAGAALFEHHLAGERHRVDQVAPDVGAERQRGRPARAPARSRLAEAKARQRPVTISTSGIITPNCGLYAISPNRMPDSDRPAVEHQQRGADQRGGEKAVVAVAEIDEHRRERDGEQQPHRIARQRMAVALARRREAQHAHSIPR